MIYTSKGKMNEERLCEFANGDDTPSLEESMKMAHRLLFLEETVRELKEAIRDLRKAKK